MDHSNVRECVNPCVADCLVIILTSPRGLNDRSVVGRFENDWFKIGDFLKPLIE